MKILSSVLTPIATALMAVWMGHCNAACNQAAREVESQALKHAYDAELGACVSTAKTPKESCMCRKGVDTKFGICAKYPEQGRCSSECM